MSIHSTGLSDSELSAWREDIELAWGQDTKLITWEGALVIRPKVAFKLLGVANTYGYKLIGDGELESYLEGRARLITVRSVFRLIARRLAANISAPSQSPIPPPTKTSPLPLSTSKRPRGRPRKVTPLATAQTVQPNLRGRPE
jgi:hypothetical protein